MANRFVNTTVPTMQFKFENSSSKVLFENWKTLIVGHSIKYSTSLVSLYLINSPEQGDYLFGWKSNGRND